MKTSEEIRARMADCEAQAEAENKAGHVLRDRALNLERLWSWASALKWTLDEEAEKKEPMIDKETDGRLLNLGLEIDQVKERVWKLEQMAEKHRS